MTELPRQTYRDWPGVDHFAAVIAEPVWAGFHMQLAPPTVVQREGQNLAIVRMYNGGEQTALWLREHELEQLVRAAQATLDALRARAGTPEWEFSVRAALQEAMRRD